MSDTISEHFAMLLTSEDNTEIPRIHQILLTLFLDSAIKSQYRRKVCRRCDLPMEMKHEPGQRVIVFPG